MKFLRQTSNQQTFFSELKILANLWILAEKNFCKALEAANLQEYFLETLELQIFKSSHKFCCWSSLGLQIFTSPRNSYFFSASNHVKHDKRVDMKKTFTESVKSAAWKHLRWDNWNAVRLTHISSLGWRRRRWRRFKCCTKMWSSDFDYARFFSDNKRFIIHVNANLHVGGIMQFANKLVG